MTESELSFFDGSHFLRGIIGIIDGLLMFYLIVVVARVIISWINPDPYNRIVQILCRLTDPALDGLRRYIPRFMWASGLDFTPLVLILLIQIAQLFLRSLTPWTEAAPRPAAAAFDKVPSQVDFPGQERRILEYWRAGDLYRKSVLARPAERPFRFYDGPPFATGLPHYGHLLASITKDVVPRYWTMRGYRVERRWGWDCHGLPVENEAEQQLGLGSRRDILEYGVPRFKRGLQGPRPALHGRVAEPDRAAGPLGRLGRPVPDDGPGLHGVGVVGVQVAVGQGARVRGPQVPRVLPPVRDAAVELRGQPGLPGDPGPVDHGPLPRGRGAGPVPARLDHDPVDPAFEYGSGRGPRHRLRPRHHRRRGGVLSWPPPSWTASSAGTTARSPR